MFCLCSSAPPIPFHFFSGFSGIIYKRSFRCTLLFTLYYYYFCYYYYYWSLDTQLDSTHSLIGIMTMIIGPLYGLALQRAKGRRYIYCVYAACAPCNDHCCCCCYCCFCCCCCAEHLCKWSVYTKYHSRYHWHQTRGEIPGKSGKNKFVNAVKSCYGFFFFVLRLGRKIKFIFSIKTCVRVCFLDFPFIHMPGIKRFLFIFYFSTFPLSEVKFMIMLLEGRQSGKGATLPSTVSPQIGRI